MTSSSRAFEWGTSYELQLFREGSWVISSIFDDRREALQEARRLDRAGRMVRLRADEFDASGQSRGTRTVFLSSAIKKSWKVEREQMIQRGIRRAATGYLEDEVEADDEHPLNPYFLLGIFSVIAFGGLGALLALRTLYAAF